MRGSTLPGRRCGERVTKQLKILRECPLCNGAVEVDADDPLLGDRLPLEDVEDLVGARARTDWVVSALCGCYVFRMDDAAIGRLFASILALHGEADERTD